MRSTTWAFAAATLMALALTGCTAPAEPAPATAETATPEARGTTGPTPADLGPTIPDPWARQKYAEFLDAAAQDYPAECGEVATQFDLQACAPHEPYAYIDAIDSPAPGDLVVTLNPRSWGGGPYDPEEVFTVRYVASNMGVMLFRATDDVDRVEVMTPDRSDVASELRPVPDDTGHTAGG